MTGGANNAPPSHGEKIIMGNPNSYSEIKNNRAQKIVFLVLFGAVAVSIAVIFRYYIWPLFFAVISYIALKPIHNFFTARLKSQRISTFLVVSAFCLLVILPSVVLMLLLANQSLEIYHEVTNNIKPADIQIYIYKNVTVKKILAYLGVREKLVYEKVMEFIKVYSFDIFSGIMKAVGFSVTFLINILFTVMFLVFLFSEAHKLTPLAYKVIPFPRDVDVDIFGRIKNVVKVLIFGNILIMVLQGAMVGVGFLIFGVNVWMVGAAAAAVFSLIPGIGTSIVWIPAVAHLAYLGKSKEAFLLAAWSLFWYLFLENVVKPHVFGKKLNFHPILFFFLLIGSVMTFNLPGVIIGPVLLTIFFSLWEIYKFLDLYNSDEKKIASIRKR